jgi:hypothetical protein
MARLIGLGLKSCILILKIVLLHTSPQHRRLMNTYHLEQTKRSIGQPI